MYSLDAQTFSPQNSTLRFTFPEAESPIPSPRAVSLTEKTKKPEDDSSNCRISSVALPIIASLAGFLVLPFEMAILLTGAVTIGTLFMNGCLDCSAIKDIDFASLDGGSTRASAHEEVDPPSNAKSERSRRWASDGWLPVNLDQWTDDGRLPETEVVDPQRPKTQGFSAIGRRSINTENQTSAVRKELFARESEEVDQPSTRTIGRKVPVASRPVLVVPESEEVDL